MRQIVRLQEDVPQEVASKKEEDDWLDFENLHKKRQAVRFASPSQKPPDPRELAVTVV